MSLATNCVQVLVNPKGFFEENDAFPSWQPSLIVLLSALLTAVPGVLIAREAMTRVPAEFGVENAALPVVLYLVLTFVTWVIAAGFLHGVSALLGAEDGSFKQTALHAGWGFVPSVMSAIFTTVAAWYALQNFSESASAIELQQQLTSQPAMKLATAIGILFTVWQGLIWAFATYRVRGVSLRNAAISAAIPTAVLVALALSQLL